MYETAEFEERERERERERESIASQIMYVTNFHRHENYVVFQLYLFIH